MGKKKSKSKKPKSKCCGKYKKKDKHCGRCPVLLREKCILETEISAGSKKKKEDGKKLKKKKKDKKKKKRKKK